LFAGFAYGRLVAEEPDGKHRRTDAMTARGQPEPLEKRRIDVAIELMRFETECCP
jgi:hypothetical protein